MYDYTNSDSYAPSATTLSAKIKNIIEQQFPLLHPDIINNAINHATNEYQQYLHNNILKYREVSDEEAANFFFNLVMERIREYNRIQFEILKSFMLAHQRHNHAHINLTPNSDLSSGFLKLNSHQQKKIFEENSKQFIPQGLRFQERIARDAQLETRQAREARVAQEARDARIIRARAEAKAREDRVDREAKAREARVAQEALEARIKEARNPGKRTSARANQRAIAAAIAAASTGSASIGSASIGSTVPVRVQPSENARQRIERQEAERRARQEQEP